MPQLQHTLFLLISLMTTSTYARECAPGWSGTDCTIPYDQCPDNIRKCFNNSKCLRNDHIDPNTGTIGYSCDCSYANGVSMFAGEECEHAATVYCNHRKGKFCTNGGTCGSYLVRGHHYEGCHCPDEFIGAHCQYLKATFLGGMPGEAYVPEIGDNFYTKDVPGFASPIGNGRDDDSVYADDETGYKYAGDGDNGYSHAGFIVSMLALMIVCGTVGVVGVLYYKNKRSAPAPFSNEGTNPSVFMDDPTAVASNTKTVQITDKRGDIL